MGMNTFVVGFIPPDDFYEDAKKIYDNCKKLNIEIPDEIEDFFGGYPPDPTGQEIAIPHKEWDDGDMRVGIEVKVEEIPKHVKVIRFINSY